MTVVLIGVLATIVTATVRNVTAEAADSGCRLDGRQVHLAVVSYLEIENTDEIPPTGGDPDRFERTLVDAGYLRAPSEWYELDTHGSLTLQEDSPC